MTISMLEVVEVQQSVCPHCGRAMEPPQRHVWIETGLRILALIAITMMLVPLGMITWRACANLLSDRDSHSILFHPLEDWTHY
jgi:hypothetical protein